MHTSIVAKTPPRAVHRQLIVFYLVVELCGRCFIIQTNVDQTFRSLGSRSLYLRRLHLVILFYVYSIYISSPFSVLQFLSFYPSATPRHATSSRVELSFFKIMQIQRPCHHLRLEEANFSALTILSYQVINAKKSAIFSFSSLIFFLDNYPNTSFSIRFFKFFII